MMSPGLCSVTIEDEPNLLLRMTDRLRQQNLLVWPQLHDVASAARSTDPLTTVAKPPEVQKWVDVLTDETRVSGGEQFCLISCRSTGAVATIACEPVAARTSCVRARSRRLLWRSTEISYRPLQRRCQFPSSSWRKVPFVCRRPCTLRLGTNSCSELQTADLLPRAYASHTSPSVLPALRWSRNILCSNRPLVRRYSVAPVSRRKRARPQLSSVRMEMGELHSPVLTSYKLAVLSALQRGPESG